MVKRGKSVNLFLLNGTPTGVIKCTMSNWIGTALKIPRSEIENVKTREELKNSSVYFLFGESEDESKPSVYIGQASARKNKDGVITRLFEHNKDESKDYWSNDAVVFTTTQNIFGSTEITYLENRFYNLAKDAGRYSVKNKNEPSRGNVTEEKESELEEFIEYATIMLGTLGYPVFIPVIDRSNDSTIENKENTVNFYLNRKITRSGITVNGIMRITSEGYVVLKGSLINPTDSISIPEKIKLMRKTVNIDSNNILQEDVLFKSPSYAGAFVIGGHINGQKEWKLDNKVTLSEYESKTAN